MDGWGNSTSQLQNATRSRITSKVALPYRFKAGGSGNMAPITTQHHHRSTTKQPQKAFKSRHASKGALKELSKGMSCSTAQAFLLTRS